MATLYAVGVGPGDPELITIKAQRILQQVQTVYVPKSGKQNRSLALEIARPHLPPHVEVEYLYMPMIERGQELEQHWQEAARQVLDGLQRGDAAFLTLGDPLTYSTATYLAEAVKRLNPQVTIIFVPGITSYNAAAARVGLPLAEGDETLVVVPSVGTAGFLKQVLTTHDTCVLMKVSRAYDTVLQVLQELGLKDNAVLVSRCGTERELVTRDLDSLAGSNIDYLSLIIIKGGNSR